MKNPLLRGAICALFLLSNASHGASGPAPASTRAAAIDAALATAEAHVDAAIKAREGVDEHTAALWDLLTVLHYEQRLPAVIDNAANALPAQRANARFFVQRLPQDALSQILIALRGHIGASQARSLAAAYATPMGQQALAGVQSAAVDVFNASAEARLLAASERAAMKGMQETILAWADAEVVNLIGTATSRAAVYKAALNDPSRRGTVPQAPQATGHADIDRMMSAWQVMMGKLAVLGWRFDDELARLGGQDMLSPATLAGADGTARGRRVLALLRPSWEAYIADSMAAVTDARAQIGTNGIAAHDRMTGVLQAVFDNKLAQLAMLDTVQREQYDIAGRMLAFADERPAQLVLGANGVEATGSAGRARWSALVDEMETALKTLAALAMPPEP